MLETVEPTTQSGAWLAMFAEWALSLLGAGKLVEMLFRQIFKNKADKKKEDKENLVAELEYDEGFLKTVLDRLKTLEADSKEFQKVMTKQAVDNAILEAERNNLREKTEHQEKEIARLGQELSFAQTRIAELTGQVKALTDIFGHPPPLPPAAPPV